MQFEYNFWWLILILALSAATSYYLYTTDRSIQNAPRTIRILLGSLRLVLLFFAGMLLFGPFLKLERSELLKPLVLILQDDSRSVIATNSDTAFINGKFKADLELLRAKVGEEYEVHSYRFGNAVTQSDSISFDESETDYSVLFADMQEKYAEENVGAIVLATDGNHTRGEALTYAARSLSTSAPYYVVALGDSIRKTDISIQFVLHNETAFVNRVSQISAEFSWNGIQQPYTHVSLYAGDSLVEKRRIRFRGENGSLTELFSFTPLKTGIVPMKLVIEPTELDKVTGNNSADFFFSVQESKKQIAFLNSQISPDAGAFFRALTANSNYEVYQIGELSDKALEKCNMLVYDGADASAIAKAKDKNIPCLWLRGNTDIRSGKYIPSVSYRGTGKSMDDVTAHVNQGFNLFAVTEGVSQLSKRAMPIKVPFGNYEIADKRVQVIAEQSVKGIATERPLIGVLKDGNHKQVFFLGTGYWHWRMQCFVDNGNFEYFDQFANTIAEFLLANSKKNRFTLKYPKTVSESEQVRLSAQVLDQSLQLTVSAEVSLSLSDSSGKRSGFKFIPAENSYSAVLGKLAPGAYNFTASAQLNDETLYEKGRIMVSESNAELLFSSADMPALQMLLDEHDGELISPRDLSHIADAISANPAKTVYYTSSEFMELIDVWWLLALTLSLLIAEWVLRKFYGGF